MSKENSGECETSYYIERIMKSESPIDLLKNQTDLVLFLNRRFGNEQEQFLSKYKTLLKVFEPKPSKPHYSEEAPEI